MHGQQRGGYYPHIDGLRAIAVLAVILYHLRASWLPGGFTGVDVFFVISGFVVSASVARLPGDGGWRDVVGFYARRMRRIMPALVTCLLATALASALFIPDSWLSETSSKTGRMAFFGLSNWILARTGNDYFSPRTEFNPYTHTWSLGVEEQFYLLFPLLFLAWGRGGRGRWLSLLLFSGATLASLAYAATRAGQPGHEIDSFYLTTTRFWQLGAGVVLFQLMTLWPGRTLVQPRGAERAVRGMLLLLSVGLLGYGFWRAQPARSPWMDGLWPVLGTLGALALLHGGSGGWIRHGLSCRPMVLIGRLSYSLYLWHWPVFVLFRWTVGLESFFQSGAALLITVLLAWASWRWVESPLRFGKWWQTKDVRWVLYGLGTLLLGSVLQSQLGKAAKHISLSVVSTHPQDWYPYAKGLAKEFPQCELVASSQPAAGGGSVQQFERGRCSLARVGVSGVFVVGDSHALAYGEMFRRLAVEQGSLTRLYGVGGCAMIGLRAQSDPGCSSYIRNALEDVSSLAKAGDVVFLPGLRVPRLVEQYEMFDHEAVDAGQRTAEANDLRSASVASAIEQLRPLADRGVRIVLEAPKPVLFAPPFRCSDAFNKSNPICARGMKVSRSEMEHLREPALSSLKQVAAALPGASIWDPMPVLCPGQSCLPADNGRPLYFDGDHLSGYGNRVLLPSFEAHLATTTSKSDSASSP